MSLEEKKPKKRVNSKAKGNSWELQIAKKLTSALAPLTFMRSPGSGMRTGGKNFEKFGMMFGEDAMKLFTSDVVPTSEKDNDLKFKWSIEAKSYKTPDNFPALVSGNANIFGWFQESVIDAAKVNKMPMLIFKWNQSKGFVAVSFYDVQANGCPSAELKLTIEKDNHKLNIYLLDDLLLDFDFWVDSL